MKLVIERNRLLKSLRHVRDVVEKRTTVPILSHVVLTADQETGLKLKATDLEREVVGTAIADVSIAGAVTVPAHTLYDIVGKLSDGAQVELTADKDKERLNVVSGRSRFALQAMDPADFPDLSHGEFTHRFEILSKDLKRLVDKVSFAMSTEETRYYLCGIYLHIAESNGRPMLRAVATDGHRLARIDVALPDGAAGMPGIILPRKTINELQRMLPDDATVTMSVSMAKARFEIGSLTFTTKLIDGTFPDYNRVIPKNHDKVMRVDPAKLAAAVDLVTAVATERGRGVKLEIDAGKLVLSAAHDSIGSAQDEIVAEYGPLKTADNNCAPMQIGFNSTYLTDIAGAIEGKTMRVLLADMGSPIVVEDEGKDDALYVLMPMRV